jgi:CRP/FNR family transcriptional regulator, cyclic AMP receptor protein
MTGSSSDRKECGGSYSRSRWPHSSFLGSLTNGECAALLSLGVERRYPTGSTILRQGEAGEFVVLILRGIAKVSIVAETGKEMLAGIRGAGELIGEMAALSSEPRSASVAAATEVHGKVIKAGVFTGHLARSPRVSSQLAQMVAARLRAANRSRLESASYPVEERIARVLGEVALAYGHREGTAWRIGPEITQADIASLSSASVRTVEKVLRTFEQEGLVKRQRRDLVVIDTAALNTRVEHFPTIPP